jgi:demethylmenaquinone methyltransferase/2-methoxy-6-polyprenyl-1,4-benzoquinol methylase
MPAVPFKDSDLTKKGQVEEMFDQISPRYDFLNHFLSANIDKIWRRKAIDILNRWQPRSILDVATGTADFALAAARIKPEKITGIDLSEGMLTIGKKKVQKRGLTHLITLVKADSEMLPFENNTYDAAIVGFGVRNFENLERGLSEIYRVLRPGGIFVILEFSRPKNRLFGNLYFLYFTKVLPLLGKIVSRNNRAYTYLPESVQDFPDGNDFLDILKKTGYKNCKFKTLTMGIASIYTAQKAEKQSVIQ